jgi:hypothetical protein
MRTWGVSKLLQYVLTLTAQQMAIVAARHIHALILKVQKQVEVLV